MRKRKTFVINGHDTCPVGIIGDRVRGNRAYVIESNYEIATGLEMWFLPKLMKLRFSYGWAL